jgi:uncharacterized caspase-like protein
VAKDEQTWTVTLPPGKHQLAVLAGSSDASAISNKEIVDARAKADLPVMHVLAIGVSEYKDKTLNLNSAVKDATGIADTFKSACKGELFEDVRTQLLPNEKATREGVLAAIRELRTVPGMKVKSNDLVVIFFAGHGAKEKDQFYLLTHEADVNALAKSTLSGQALREVLGGFPCQVLLIMDACHSAGFGAGGALAAKNLKPATDEVTRSLTDDEVGVAVMCAAMSYETAKESKKNGLFTGALMEALRERDVPHNRTTHKQFIHHLQAHVFDRVVDESKETQHPFLHLPWTVESFAVRKVP